MEIRFVEPAEVEQLRRNVQTAFPSKTPQALLDNMPEELVRPEEGRYLGCFDDDGTMIGSLLMMDFEMNVRGKMMKMGAPAYVSTNFLHKKEHIARNLLRVQMGVFAQTGTAIGALHPFNPAFYRKMGYGYCTEQVMYSPRPQYIRSYGDKSGLSYAGPEDEEEILEFYRQYARKTHGATIHPFMDKHRIFDEPYVVVCRRNGKITGYLTFDFVQVDHYTDMYHDLAVRSLTKKGTSPIICLVGPPGTGKTSIARSVAKALNKKYVRISLGGVRDEAEIRGHRKTYVGAMPGRLVEGLRQAGVANPLMLLDEIDKVSSDYKGDTSSALLEVLDGEQNVKFRDHYVEVPVDLSQVLFIATANTTQTIPGPLLDRMELIEVNSYTENEKFHIAKDYLVGKQIERNGLTPQQIVFSDKCLEKIIHNYTREAGVRNLERRIGDVCRKAARKYLEKKQGPIRVNEGNLEKYLGKERVSFEDANEEDEVGIVRGLAWTSVGGDTLQIEVNVMPGKGNLLMTGQMGDVMKESAQIALTYVRSICPDYQVADDYFEKHDLHLHIPEGAVPKDGPSAGITMATAMLSAVIGRKVLAKVAMTGEITLRGRVLPIGGLKEKILAAKMAHIKKVLVPDKNRPDMAELSKEITRGLEIVYVKNMDEVIKEAFV